MNTTIQITKKTREMLNQLKPYKRATYDEIIGALIGMVPEGDDEGIYTAEFRASLVRSMDDVSRGRTYSASEMKKKLGI